MKSKATLGSCVAVGLLILAVLSPVLQVYWPLGVAATRDSIATWSYGLAQIAFGLVAAFVIFLLPQVVEVGRLYRMWNLTRLYYTETDRFDRDDAFRKFQSALEVYAALPGSQVSGLLKKWLKQNASSKKQSMTSQEVERAISVLARELRDVVGSKERWLLMVEKTASTLAKPWDVPDEMRRWLFAVYSTETLRSTHWTLIALLLALIGISVIFGTLALAPDPFLYHSLTRYLTNRGVLFRSEPNYPEISMWITACSYLAAIFFLALLFALQTLTIHVHDPTKFDEKAPCETL